MLKLINTTGGAITAGQVVPFTVKYATNNKIGFDTTTNEVIMRQPGFYDINASATVTATGTTNISLQLYANNVAIPEAIATITPASGSTYTLVIPDIEKILASYNLQFAKLTFKLSTACTLVSANASFVEIR